MHYGSWNYMEGMILLVSHPYLGLHQINCVGRLEWTAQGCFPSWSLKWTENQ